MRDRINEFMKKLPKETKDELGLQNGDADWRKECENCGETPTVHPTSLCGPCCFGEAETAGGNW